MIYIVSPTESILTPRGNRHPQLANYLSSKGNRITYIASNYSHSEKKFIKRDKIISESSKLSYLLKIISVPAYNRNISFNRIRSNIIFSIKTLAYIKRRIVQNDTIIIPSRPIELIWFIALLKRKYKINLIVDVRDIWPDAFKSKGKILYFLFSKYCNFFLKRSLYKADLFLYIAPSFSSWINRYTMNRTSLFVPLGLDMERWANFNSVHKFNNLRNLVCIAQLQYQIDIMPILQTIKNDKEKSLTIIGEDGCGERYHEVKEYIIENSMTNVVFAGKVPRNKVPELMSKQDIAIVPMISSSLPNKVFDYLGAGIPIIVLGSNDASGFVIENNFGWGCEYNHKAFSKLIYSISKMDYNNKLKSIAAKRRSFDRKELFRILENKI